MTINFKRSTSDNNVYISTNKGALEGKVMIVKTSSGYHVFDCRTTAKQIDVKPNFNEACLFASEYFTALYKELKKPEIQKKIRWKLGEAGTYKITFRKDDFKPELFINKYSDKYTLCAFKLDDTFVPFRSFNTLNAAKAYAKKHFDIGEIIEKTPFEERKDNLKELAYDAQERKTTVSIYNLVKAEAEKGFDYSVIVNNITEILTDIDTYVYNKSWNLHMLVMEIEYAPRKTFHLYAKDVAPCYIVENINTLLNLDVMNIEDKLKSIYSYLTNEKTPKKCIKRVCRQQREMEAINKDLERMVPTYKMPDYKMAVLTKAMYSNNLNDRQKKVIIKLLYEAYGIISTTRHLNIYSTYYNEPLNFTYDTPPYDYTDKAWVEMAKDAVLTCDSPITVENVISSVLNGLTFREAL